MNEEAQQVPPHIEATLESMRTRIIDLEMEVINERAHRIAVQNQMKQMQDVASIVDSANMDAEPGDQEATK